MSLDLFEGSDGYYGVCFKSDESPNLNYYKRLFAKYDVLIRTDQKNNWVFIRSPNKQNIESCIEEHGHMYPFQEIKNSRKVDNTRSTSNATGARSEVAPAPSADRSHLGAGDMLVLSKKPTRVEHAVFLGLPPSMHLQDVYELCSEAGVFCVLLQMETTELQKVRYCSVYVRTAEDVNELCSRYNRSQQDGHTLLVKSANALLQGV